jgi:hypothetical protein
MAIKELNLRRSPFVMLKQIIILEILIGFLYIIPTSLEKLGFFTLEISHIIHSDIYFVIAMVLLQIIVISLVFVRWYQTLYTVNGTKVVVRQNFIGRREENYKADKIASLVLTQNLLNRLFNAGSLVAKNNAGNILFVLKDIAEPAYHLSLIEQIQKNTNRTKPVVRTTKSTLEIIKGGESQSVEFKSSFSWDNRKKINNKELQHAIMKTITGFMNTQGGTLLIGVNDKKEVIGLKDDIKNLKKKNLDGFENFFNLVFTHMVGLEFRHYVDIKFEKVRGKNICIVNVKKSKKPVYVKNKKEEEFYIRAGNATHPLSISEATRYIQENFRGKRATD